MQYLASSLVAKSRCGASHAVVTKGTSLMMQVVVSILSFNSMQSTIACVQSLLSGAHVASDQYSLEIIVADNDPSQDSKSKQYQTLVELPNVHLKINSENLGFAAGHNHNLRTIFKQFNPDYVWLLNNDCLVDEVALSALLKCAMKRPDVGVWGATLLESDGQTIQCAGGCFYNSWISSYRQYGRGRQLLQRDQLPAVDFDYIAGASMFFPIAALQNGLQALPGNSGASGTSQRQWLNESFFLYFEELDLVKRLRPGLGIAWCKDALIQHTGGKSFGIRGRQRTTQSEYYSDLSALIFTRMYHPRRLCLMVPLRYLLKSLLLIFRGDFHLLAPLTSAYRTFFTGTTASSSRNL